jgi:hypothetical protein
MDKEKARNARKADKQEAKNAKNASPRAMLPNNPAKKLRPRQPQNCILLASPLLPPHMSLLLIPQAPRTGFAFGQPPVVRLPMVIINRSLLFL